MKPVFLILAILIPCCFFTCKKQDCHNENAIPPCIEAQIEDFKQETYATSVIKISRPDGPLYWFVDEIADAGEKVLDENCELVCVTDCECDGDLVFCDGSHFDFPQEVIWQR